MSSPSTPPLGYSPSLKLAGYLAVLAVASPTAAAIARRPSTLAEPTVIAWIAAIAAFVASYAALDRLLRRSAIPVHAGSRLSPAPALALAAQSSAALTANALNPSVFGGVSLTGVLLVVVAGALPRAVPGTAARAWIAAQSAGLFLTYTLACRWQWPIAAASTAAYLAFQFFALFAAASARDEAIARAALADANSQLRAAQDLLADQARTAERERIWRELHDVTGHHLAALSLTLEAAAKLTEGNAQQLVRRAGGLTRLMLAEIRSVMSDSAPTPPADLQSALRNLADSFRPLPVHLHLDTSALSPSPAAAHAVLRCAQEFLTNTLRHSGATQAELTLTHGDGRLVLTASDTGRGAERPRPGRGLTAMRARVEELGGTLVIQTAPGQGFRITATLPDRREATP